MAVLLALTVATAFAEKPPAVNLIWEPSASQDVAYYRVYYAVSPDAFGTGGVGPWGFVTVTNGEAATISGLRRGVTYYVAATAVGLDNQESEYSNVVEWTAPGVAAPPPAVQISLPEQLSSLDDLYIHASVSTNGNAIHSLHIFESSTEDPIIEGAALLWSRPPAGSYSFYAVVYYNHGFSVTSEARVVYVSLPEPVPMQKAPEYIAEVSLLSLSPSLPPPQTQPGFCEKCFPFWAACISGSDMPTTQIAECLALLAGPEASCCADNCLSFATMALRQEAALARSAPEWVTVLPQGHARQTLISAWLESAARHNRDQAAAWLRTLPLQDQRYGWPALKRAFRGMAPEPALNQ